MSHTPSAGTYQAEKGTILCFLSASQQNTACSVEDSHPWLRHSLKTGLGYVWVDMPNDQGLAFV